MNICDSCYAREKKVENAYGETFKFSITEQETAKAKHTSDILNLCHECQKQTSSVVFNLAWIIKEHGIEHLATSLRAARNAVKA